VYIGLTFVGAVMGAFLGMIEQHFFFKSTRKEMFSKARQEAKDFAWRNPGTKMHEVRKGNRLEITVE
jgi:hypothetical protein